MRARTEKVRAEIMQGLVLYSLEGFTSVKSGSRGSRNMSGYGMQDIGVYFCVCLCGAAGTLGFLHG